MDSYAKQIKRLKKIKKDDKSTYHELQDEIYRKFISDIADGKLTKLKDIKAIAKSLKEKLVDIDIELWYA